jgi:hypothetical protein
MQFCAKAAKQWMNRLPFPATLRAALLKSLQTIPLSQSLSQTQNGQGNCTAHFGAGT